MYLQTLDNTGSCNVQFLICLAVIIISSKCLISNTNSAGVGNSDGASGKGNLLNASALLCCAVERNSNVYSNEAKVRAQRWILLEACTGTGLFPASND